MRFVLWLLAFTGKVYGQDLLLNRGSLDVGTGGAQLAQSGIWSGFQNPALPDTEGFSLALASAKPWIHLPLFIQAAAIQRATSRHVWRAALAQMGTAHYAQQQFATAYGLKLNQNLYVGTKLEYFQMQNSEIGRNRPFLRTALGLFYQLNQKLAMGMAWQSHALGKSNPHFSNLNRMGLAIQWQESDKSVFLLETNQSAATALRWQLGWRYQVVKSLEMGFGFADRPFALSSAFRWKYRKLFLGSGFAWQIGLNSSLAIDIAYAWP